MGEDENLVKVSSVFIFKKRLFYNKIKILTSMCMLRLVSPFGIFFF